MRKVRTVDADIVSLYTEEKRSLREISIQYRIGAMTVMRVLDRNGIKRRPQGGGSKKNRNPGRDARIVRLYVDERKTLRAIGAEVGLSPTRTRKILLENQIELRTRGGGGEPSSPLPESPGSGTAG